MSAKQFVFSLIFKGDAAGAKAAGAEAKAAVEAVSAETKAAIPATDQDTAAQKKNTQARREAAAAAREQAEAEKRAREEAQRGIGGSGAPTSSPTQTPGTAPASLPQTDLDKLKAQYVPIFAAQKAYEEELAGVSKAERAGALTSAEAAAAQARLRANYDRTTESLRRADAALGSSTGKMKLQAHESKILMMQVSDSAQTLALGMSPLQVLLQQGPQVVDVLGGVGNTLRFLRQSLTGMRVLMGGTAAAVITGAVAWDQYLKSIKAVEVAAAGRGQALGVTTNMLEAAARSGGDQANLSTADSRALMAQLVSSGQIGAQNLEGVLGISSDFAVTMGIDPEQVGSQLATMFAKPGKAAEELRASHSMLDASTVESIQRLEAQNRKYEAQAALLDALRGKLVAAETAQTALGRGWGAIGRGIGNGMDATGSLINDVAEVSNPRDIGMMFNPAGLSKKLWDVVGQKQDEALARSLQDGIAEAMRPATEGRQRGQLALQLADRTGANASPLKQQALQDEIVAMQAGLAAGDLSLAQRARIETAIEAQSAALDAMTFKQERANTLSRLDMQIATERNPLRRADLAGLQAFIKASEAGIPVAERLAEGDRARAQALNEVLAGAANQSALMAEEAIARDRLNTLVAQGTVSASDASTWMERELTLRPLLAAAARAEGKDKSDLEAEIRKLEKGYDDLAAARRQEMVIADGRASDDRIAQLQQEANLIGRSNADRTRALALAEAEKRIREIGINPASTDAKDLRDDARAEAEAQIRRDQQQRDFDLRNQRAQDAYSASSRLAINPIARADIEAEAAYAAAIAQGADATEAAARAAQVRARAMTELRGSIMDMVRAQDDQLDRLRLEAQLVGVTDAARTRAMVSYEADLEMQRMGLDLGSQQAAQMRERAVLLAEQQRETDQLVDAWGKVRGAAETAIDAPFDALLNGDLKGAALAAVREIGEVWTELAWKNPLKNRLLGTDYTTLDDMGGIGGIVGQLFGKGEATSRLTTSSMNAASMAATTPMVTLNAGGVTGLPAFAGGAGHAAAAGMGAGGALPGSGDIQSQIWAFFAGKGLQPHQIAGVMGNVAAESSFNPLAVGDSGAAHGLFQWNNRAPQLFDFIGGQGNLGNVQSQLEFAWKELMTTENGPYQRLMASTNVYDATHAFTGFERPSGYSASNPQSADGWSRRIAGAEAALSKFEGTSVSAQAQLGQLGTGAQTLGTGMQQMTANLAGTLQGIGASYGPGGAFIGGLLGEGLKLLTGGGAAAKPAGYMIGGYTGPGATTDVAGVVHAEEYVFDAASTRRIGVSNLEAMRRGALKGYREGGYVVGGRSPVPSRMSGSASNMAAAATAPKLVEMHLKVSGTGNTEVREATAMAIRQALEAYDRDAMPERVRMVVDNRWEA